MLSEFIITILGSSGGVASAILSILNKSANDVNDPIHKYICNAHLHLIDISQKDSYYFSKSFPNLKNKISLHQFDLNNLESFKSHLLKTNTNLVIDVSWADTIDMLSCCNELGIYYINSALENTSVDENEDLEGFTLSERYILFEEAKSLFDNTKAIIGSGMNPGVVQWMAIHLMNQIENKKPKACYVVEFDNSFFEDKSLAKENTVYTTWSPECFLDEAILSYPLFVTHNTPLFMYKDVYSLEFKVNLGEFKFYGCLMPHEEILTLGELYDMELGFIYKVNDHTTNLIRNNLDNVDIIWDKPMEVLDPSSKPLIGYDLVGVLLVFDSEELYMYNVLNNKDIFEIYGVNATYFQVACGIYGSICSIILDDIPNDIYYVDTLILNTNSNYGKYLSYYMKDFVYGKNSKSDGLLLDRIKYI